MHKVVYALFKKYVPQYLVYKIELRRALNDAITKKEEDPENLFKAISGIINKYVTAKYQFKE